MANIEIPAQFKPLYSIKNGIKKYPSDILKRMSVNVSPSEDISKIVHKMKQLLNKSKGAGLAAPQIGINKRIIMVKSMDKIITLINPKITQESGVYLSREGCLSIPGVQGVVQRSKDIELWANTLKGNEYNIVPRNFSFSDFGAAVVQHEIDHLDGILFIDKAILNTIEWTTN